MDDSAANRRSRRLGSTQAGVCAFAETERTIHRLYFDPVDGFILWATHASWRLGVDL